MIGAIILWYGRTQCLGAWRPWRRLATQDGAESVVDHGVYRFAFKGPVVRYPMGDLQQKPGGYSGYTTSPLGQPLTNRVAANDGERNQSPRGSFYLFDGMHKTLVLAKRLLKSETAFQAMEALYLVPRRN